MNVVSISRLFFVLPEPLPFLDGYEVVERVGDAPHDEPCPDDPWVLLHFHQVRNSYGRARGMQEALSQVLTSLPDSFRQKRVDADLDDLLLADYTVIEAWTPRESPDSPGGTWSGAARDLPARSDAINRCLRLVQDYARAYRIAQGAAYGVPTYERILPSVVGTTGAAPLRPENDVAMLDRASTEWGEPRLIMLEHVNAPDVPAETAIGPGHVDWPKFENILDGLRRGDPFFISGERLLDAHRAHQVFGDHAAAVALSQTASEVFLDAFLALLMWEEGQDPEQAARVFIEGKSVARLKSELPRRLKGNWSLNGTGPVAIWFRTCAQLRHRVVHGGYSPNRQEAEAAYEAVLGLRRHCHDQLAKRRNHYKRSTLIALGELGLRQRQLWKDEIKRFAEQDAPREPSWRQDLKLWQNRLMAAQLADLGS